jgi:tetratricopeptide (TPR) repeat protein
MGGPDRFSPMLEYLGQLNRGIPWGDALRAAFELEPEELERELDKHRQRVRKEVPYLEVMLRNPVPELQARELSRSEAASLLAELALALERARLARSLLRETLALEPDHARGLALAAEAAALDRDFTASSQYIEQAIARAPANAAVQESLGNVWAHRARAEPELAREHLERAREACTRAAQLAPHVPSAFAQLGTTFVDERDCAALRQGTAALERARALVP